MNNSFQNPPNPAAGSSYDRPWKFVWYGPFSMAESFTDVIIGCLEYGSIVLNPDYQREAVWDEHRASTLINSISSTTFQFHPHTMTNLTQWATLSHPSFSIAN